MKAKQTEMFVLQNHFMAQITPYTANSRASVLTRDLVIQSVMLAFKLKTEKMLLDILNATTSGRYEWKNIQGELKM